MAIFHDGWRAQQQCFDHHSRAFLLADQGFGSYSYGNHTGNGTVSVANSTGQYTTTFSVPASWAGERIFLVYEGVLTDTATTINGQPSAHSSGRFF